MMVALPSIECGAGISDAPNVFSCPIQISARALCRASISHRMDLRHLRTFVTVAELGSVSKASLRLHVAQPALSRQIIDLETELGLKLFDRIGRRLSLSKEGEHLVETRRRLLGNVALLGEQALL